MLRAGAVLGVLWAVSAAAQVVPERELEAVRNNFNVGNYKEALTRATSAMEVANFNDSQRSELHKYAGVSAFNLGDLTSAEKHFLAVLQINPDYVLDPFAYPPPAIRLFEDVKKKNATTLSLIRQQIAVREEQTRREIAERERTRALAEEQRRRLEELARKTTVTTIERKSFITNFIPFGVGQFQQGRNAFGIFLAISEGAFAAVSLVAYLALESLFEYTKYTFTDRLGVPNNTFVVSVRRIPDTRRTEAEGWKIVKYTSGIAFYVTWAAGAGEAIWRHQDEVITTETKRLDEVTPEAPPSPPGIKAPRLFLFPTLGGMGAGFSLNF